ncbi:NIPSNAP family protein [Shinella sp. CPCC 101442]|uniref:NIPSNAP family protein n=1 Tax=Shinella sp. CPCC 101442 TaxID=2932265 RepID=UPI002152730D|nr:NIPSNAP family protein [Shinella sp. CPCC 101442]MCR6498862.1 NIPSNAP family protein [Shinella sp. CPCC 101442]
MAKAPVTCEVRYRLDPGRIADFQDYARIWTTLIERYGGAHHGYFLPRAKPDGAGMSFPGAGDEGAGDIAVALFTFPDEAAYLLYRSKVAEDADGIAANARFAENPPFKSYERTFLQPLP